MNDIYTMRTELANDFAVAGAKLLSFTATAGALAAIPETEPQQYVVAGTLESIQKVLPADEPSHPQRRLRRGDRPAEPLSFDEAAPAAPDGLNAERIVEIYRDTFNNMPGAAREAPRNVPPLVVEFGRAIAKECVASVAPAEPVIPAPSVKPWHERTSQYETPEFSQIERMEAEIAELRHLANYRLQRVNALADQIQAYSDEIARQAQPTGRDAARNAALEEAAAIVDAEHGKQHWSSWHLFKPMSEAIRALKGKSGSGKPSADEQGE
jgi:hypothetical protein